MGRNRLIPRHDDLRRVGVILGALTWAVAAVGAQGVVGADFGDSARRLEERLERQIEQAPAAEPVAPPPRPPEGESLEPWELVRV